jgi:hypothetical protein
MDTHRYGGDEWKLEFLYLDTMHLSMDIQRYGGDGWQLAFLYIDTMHLTMDTYKDM